MPRYTITERAGRFVAGHSNTGVGTTLELSERVAAHEVRLGTLVPIDAQPSPAADEPTPALDAAPPGDPDDDDAPARKPRRSRKTD